MKESSKINKFSKKNSKAGARLPLGTFPAFCYIITKTRPYNILQFVTAVKKIIFR